MRWTCVEPLKKWRLDVEPNESGIEWELYYEPTAPMWELLPMKVRDKDGQMLADMYHMKEPGPVDRLGADRRRAHQRRRIPRRP